MRKIIGYSLWFSILFTVLFAMLFLASCGLLALTPRDETSPVIDIWYGPRQAFGEPGLPQRWVNVLGNASDPQSSITSLHYRLNGGYLYNLHMGPDKRRLLMRGDFNVEIDPLDLHAGDNHLTIEATNSSGLKTSVDVTVTYHHSLTVQPLPYRIDWSTLQNAQDALQIVDGKWRWDTNGIRSTEIGYDRMLTVGDSRWTDYVVTVPVTVNAIDPTGFNDKYSGKQASVAIDLRWQGHSDAPVKCPQPHCGWDPNGNFNKFFYRENGENYLGMKIREKEEGYPTVPYHMDLGTTYIFKVSVENTSQGPLYRMKVWEKDVENEPTGWTFERLVDARIAALKEGGSPSHGAFALVAHYADITFGDILVEPVAELSASR